jgi:hypothetical protein
MTRVLACLAALLALCATPVLAGGSLSIRLVEASNNGTGDDGGMGDISGVLHGSLRFSRYALIASATVALPATGQPVALGGYAVTCSGPRSGLSIEVSSGGRRLLKTSAALQDNAPLILGCFQSKAGKHVVVIVAH